MSNFFVGFLENLRHQKDILKLTDLYFCSHPIRERPILHPSAPAAETRWILDMGPYGAASQGELGTFTVPRHRLHKPGPKVSIFQVILIMGIQG